jgi:hypothetical protein
LPLATTVFSTVFSAGCLDILDNPREPRGLGRATVDLSKVYPLEELQKNDKKLRGGMLIGLGGAGGTLERQSPFAFQVESSPNSFFAFRYTASDGRAFTVLADKPDFALTKDAVVLVSDQPVVLEGRVHRLWFDARADSLKSRLPETR